MFPDPSSSSGLSHTLTLIRALVDFGIVFALAYQVILLIRGTRAVSVLIGLALLVGTYFASGESLLNLTTVHWIFKEFMGTILLIVVILFQQDIRRALSSFVDSRIIRRRSRQQSAQYIEELIRSASNLARHRLGGLIVIERTGDLSTIIEGGFTLDADISKELLFAIFNPENANPLHDGAVVIRNGRIASAGCFLPLTTNPKVDKALGTRHRAAIGLTEEKDAAVLIVSEETGAISIAVHGNLRRDIESNELRSMLHSLLEGGRLEGPEANSRNKQHSTRSRFSGVYRNNIAAKATALAVAASLWVLVLVDSRRDDTETYTYQLELGEVPEGYALVSSLPRIDVKLQGGQRNLRRFPAPTEPVIVDIESPDVVRISVSRELLGIPNNLKIERTEPTSFPITLEPLEETELDVELNITGRPPAGFGVGEVHLEPLRVPVLAPRSIVPALRTVRTEAIDLSDATENIVREVHLSRPNEHVRWQDEEPRALVQIEIQKATGTRNFDNLAIILTGPQPERCEFTPNHFRLVVRGASEDLIRLNPDDLFAEINCARLSAQGTGTYTQELEVRNLGNLVAIEELRPSSIRINVLPPPAEEGASDGNTP